MRKTVWISLAIALLKEIETKKQAYYNVLKRISRLQDEYYKMKGPVLSSTPVQGGALNKEEERRLNNLAEREELEVSAIILKNEIAACELAWNQLNHQHQVVLTYFFINRPHNHIDNLVDVLNLEKTRIYELKDEAICEFAQRRYGKF